MRKSAIYTDEQFIEAVKTSFSVIQVLRKLGLKDAGGNHNTIKTKIEKMRLSIDHWGCYDKRGWAKGLKFPNRPRIPLEEILVETSFYHSSSLKKRLFTENIFEKKCYRCSRTEWEGVGIPLEIEHKNGNHYDNRIENLTILCPNCHALTETNSGKNHYRKTKKDREKVIEKVLSQSVNGEVQSVIFVDKSKLSEDLKTKSAKDVGKEIGVSESFIRNYCKRHNIQIPSKNIIRDRKFNIEKDDLEKLVWEKPMEQIGKEKGVTSNTVAKWCKKYGIENPSRGYWAKKYAGK